MQGVSPKKKNPAQAVREKKFVPAENPPPPITFLMVRPLHVFVKKKEYIEASRHLTMVQLYIARLR